MANTMVAKTALSFYKDECQRHAFDKTSPVSGIQKFIEASTTDMLSLAASLNSSTLFNREFQVYVETLVQAIKESKAIAPNESNRETFLNILTKIDLAATSGLAILSSINRVDKFETAKEALRKVVINTSWKASKMYDTLIGPLSDFFSAFSYLKSYGVINAPFMVVDLGIPDSKYNQIKFSTDNLRALYQLAIALADGYDIMKENNKDDYDELILLINKYIGSKADCNTCTCYECPNHPKKYPDFEPDEDEIVSTGCPKCPGHYHYEGDPQCNGWHHIGCSTPKPSTPSKPVEPDEDDDQGSYSCSTKK